MAGCAALVDDGGDVPVEGDGSGGRLGGIGGTAGSEENRQTEPDQKGRETGGFEIPTSTGGAAYPSISLLSGCGGFQEGRE